MKMTTQADYKDNIIHMGMGDNHDPAYNFGTDGSLNEIVDFLTASGIEVVKTEVTSIRINNQLIEGVRSITIKIQPPHQGNSRMICEEGSRLVDLITAQFPLTAR
jgi:hypothetical protein